MVGFKIPRVGVKITQGILTPGGQAAQGVKINCYTSTKCKKKKNRKENYKIYMENVRQQKVIEKQ